MSIQTATKALISYADLGKIGFEIGVITKAEKFPKARNPSYKVTAKFNNRELTTSAQLPANYPKLENLFNKIVVAITNLPSRKIAGFNSQFLMVGFPNDDHKVWLLNTRGRQVPAGLRLDISEKAPEKMVYEDFQKAAIHAGEVKEMTKETDEYVATVDIGDNQMRKVRLMDIDDKIAAELKGTQMAVVINVESEIKDEAIPLTFPYEGKRIPLGIDHPVKNGVELF